VYEQLADNLVAFFHRHHVAPFWLFIVTHLKYILSSDTNETNTFLSVIYVDKQISALLNVIGHFDIRGVEFAFFSCPLNLSVVFSISILFFSNFAFHFDGTICNCDLYLIQCFETNFLELIDAIKFENISLHRV
jgi:hypothetical protein